MLKVQIILFDKSVLIHRGLSSVIEKIPIAHTIHFINSSEEFLTFLNTSIPDLIISNTELIEKKHVKPIREIVEKEKIKYISLEFCKPYDSTSFLRTNIIDLNSSENEICEIITKLIGNIKKEGKAKKKEIISTREENIVRAIAMGLSNKEIADKLFISQHTVITHRKNITRKLGIKSVSGLTIYAILNNLIRMDEVE